MQKRLSYALLILLLCTGALSTVEAGPAGGEAGLAPTSVPMLGPEFQLSRVSTASGEDWFAPVAAYNPVRHSQVMFTHAHASSGGDVYGYYWSHKAYDWVWFWTQQGIQPAVAYNRAQDDFLVVSMFDSDADGHYEIWGQIIEGDGSMSSPSFLIYDWADRSFWSPRVAWNSYRNEYLVVWTAVNTLTGLPNDVAGVRVSASGSALSAYAILIAVTGTPHQADVTYNVAADEYLVVWRRYVAADDWDIYGARLRGDNGALIPPGEFPISVPVEDQRSPSVATNQQGRYLVVWEYAYPGPCCDWDIRGQELDITGAPVGSVIIVSQTTDDETNPRIVARPGPQRDYVAVWQKDTSLGSEIWASRWGDGSVPFAYFQVTAAAWWDYARPFVAITGARYLFVYEGDSQGDPTVLRHIYGRFWTTDAVFLPAVLRK